MSSLKEEDFTDKIKSSKYGQRLYAAHLEALNFDKYLNSDKNVKLALTAFGKSFMHDETVLVFDSDNVADLGPYLKNSSESDPEILIFMLRVRLGQPEHLRSNLAICDELIKQAKSKSELARYYDIKSGCWAFSGKFKEAMGLNQKAYDLTGDIEHVARMASCSWNLRLLKQAFKYWKTFHEKSEWMARSRVDCEYTLANFHLSLHESTDTPNEPQKSTESFVYHMCCALIAEKNHIPFGSAYSITEEVELTMNHFHAVLDEFCFACGKKASMKCSRCNMFYYCSGDCQKLDWKMHSKMCTARPKHMKARVIIAKGEGSSSNQLVNEFHRMQAMETNKIISGMVRDKLPEIRKRLENSITNL